MLVTMAQKDKKETVVREESGLYNQFSKSNYAINLLIWTAFLKCFYIITDSLIEAKAMALKEQLARKEKKETKEKDLLFQKAQ